MALEVVVFPARRPNPRRGRDSCGVLAVPVVSQAHRGQGLHWLLAFKVLVSDTANGILVPSLLSPLAKVFTCASPHTRLTGVLPPCFPNTNISHVAFCNFK